MKNIVVVFLAALLLIPFSSCGRAKKKVPSDSNRSELEQTVQVQNTECVSDVKEQEGTEEMKEYDFSVFDNVEITGIDVGSLHREERAVLYAQANYCQAMTDADIETLRALVSEDMVFTHMSGRQQSREEYFADIARGRLRYFKIGIENPVIEVNGSTATVRFTSVLNANAYGARGTFRMCGVHAWENQNGAWIAVNR